MATADLVPLPRCHHLEMPERSERLTKRRFMPRILKKSIFFLTTAILVFAVLLVRDPRGLSAATASLFGTSATQESTDQPMPSIQTTVSAQALPPIETRAPSDDEIARAFKPVSESQTESVQPQAEALFKQFEAWAAEEDARARATAERVHQLKDVPAQLAQDARADIRPLQKLRQVGREHHVRAQIHQAKNARVQTRSYQEAAAQAGPPKRNPRVVRRLQNALAEDRTVQNAERQWHEQLFDWLR